MSSSIKLTNSSGKIVTITNPDTTSADVTVDLLNNAYTIATVDDFGTVPVGYTTVIVKDTDRGGVFNRIASTTANGGTIFDGTTGYSWVRQYSGPVNVKWFGAKRGDDITAIYPSIVSVSNTIIVDDSFKTTGLAVTSDITFIGNGSISSALSDSRIFAINNGAKITIDGLTLIGSRPNTELEYQNIAIQVDNGVVIANKVKIYNFAGCGVNFISGGLTERISTISNCEIYDNATGINTNDYEYIRIDNNTIHSNGLNTSKTNWSNLYGNGTGYGILGRFANCSLTNNTINGNAIGVYLNSLGGSNPDHNRISNNTINHNYAAGLILQGLNSYETIIGNQILSNVTKPEAPTVIYLPRGTSVDLSIVDCIGLNFIGNDVGPGSDTLIPIFGHARCRYIGNNWIYYPPTELRHPETGALIYDFYGYLKNGDNLFTGNMIRNESSANLSPTILTDSVRTVIKNEIYSAGAGAGSGGGKMVDDVIYKIGYTNGWAQFGSSIESYYVKKASKQVEIYIAAIAPASTNLSITTLPAAYRPSNPVFGMAGVGNNLSSSYGTIYQDGTITVVGAIAGQPVVINFSYVTDY